MKKLYRVEITREFAVTEWITVEAEDDLDAEDMAENADLVFPEMSELNERTPIVEQIVEVKTGEENI